VTLASTKDTALSPATDVARATTAPHSRAPRPLAWHRRWLRAVRLNARRFLALCRREKVWAVCTALFVLIWTVELFSVQAATFVYPNATPPSFDFWAPKVRFVLDLLFIGGIVFWLRRRWLSVLAVAAFFVYLGLITYFQYFARPLSLLTILGSWREGLQVGGFAFDLFPKRVAALLLVVLAVQMSLLFLSRGVSLPRSCRRLGGSALAVAYVAIFLVANYYDPLSYIQSTRGLGRLGEIRGYLGPWMAEWFYLGDDLVLRRAIELRDYSDKKYDRLTPLEADIPIHQRVVILQAESFDRNVLNHRVAGQEVTPFLNSLQKRSMYYRIRSMHANASADADFTTLTGVRGSDHENTYIIPGYPYRNTTPQVLAECGFETYSFHGFGGDFYSRRQPFERMGLTGVYFQEELERDFGLHGDRWGVRDKDVLTLSALKLREASTPTCHFVITLTTHTPYTMIPPDAQEVFAHPRTTSERYLNNMRYLDNCLRDYIVSLGSGVTVMIYSDHPTEEMEFRADREGAIEYIPCLIYDSDCDLSKLQKTRKMPMSTDGTLNQVDLIKYLRAQVLRTFRTAKDSDAATSK
jgi:phosphoglycerol transferase MdoB-like AlkP superfamily enzyme